MAGDADAGVAGQTAKKGACMDVRFKVGVAGVRFVARPGDVRSLPEKDARRLIASGQAEALPAQPAGPRKSRRQRVSGTPKGGRLV